jgi:cyclophilin family peptidyl-prolyl cis-trans isomerase
VRPDWSPLGAARFFELVDEGFFTNMLLYRAIEGFLVQFGVSSRSDLMKKCVESPFFC